MVSKKIKTILRKLETDRHWMRWKQSSLDRTKSQGRTGQPSENCKYQCVFRTVVGFPYTLKILSDDSEL